MGLYPSEHLNAREKWLLLNPTTSAISSIAIFAPRLASMWSSARFACQAARPPGRTWISEAEVPACDPAGSVPRSIDASLRQRHAASRLVSKNVNARLTRCPTQAEDDIPGDALTSLIPLLLLVIGLTVVLIRSKGVNPLDVGIEMRSCLPQ